LSCSQALALAPCFSDAHLLLAQATLAADPAHPDAALKANLFVSADEFNKGAKFTSIHFYLLKFKFI
jgi:hypothetical protein